MSEKTVYDKLVDWFDVKLGFAKTPLKPVPDFNQNPLYWLGALMVVSFGLQVATGMFMLLYYVPTPTQAYSSTMFIINSVPLGKFVETLHLYSAYAMILLVFLHLTRNFFGSAYKGNRDLMWLAGLGLGAIVVSFGVTGYLLPWTVISKSATDVAIGFTNFLPTGLANLGKFVLTGSGSDASTLTTFLHIHTVFLPAALLVFLALKVYMFEVHGPSYIAAYGKPKIAGGKYIRWFPKIFLYAIMVGSAYVAILLAASSIVPLALPPAFSPATAGQYIVQPDWYLLWLYQILKIQAFESDAAVYAIAGLAVVLVLFLLLPFYDRSKRKGLAERPLYVTVGSILAVELVALTAWGYLTPGQLISNEQAALLLGGLAMATAAVVWAIYRVRRNRKNATATPLQTSAPAPKEHTAEPTNPPSKTAALKRRRFARSVVHVWQGLVTRFTAVFVIFLAIASVSLATLFNMLGNLALNLPFFVLTAMAFAVSMFLMCNMLRSFVRAYEKGAYT